MARKYKLKITELPYKKSDRDLLENNYRHVSELQLLISKAKSDDVKNMLKNEIRDIRSNLFNMYSQKFYKVQVILGPHVEEEIISYYPTIYNVLNIKDKLIRRLHKKRKGCKRIEKVYREFNGFGYEMVGENRDILNYGETTTRLNNLARQIFATPTGIEFRDVVVNEPILEKGSKRLSNLKGGGRVFVKPGSILSLMTSESYEQRVYRPKVPYDKSNYVGVELEIVCKVDAKTLSKAFVKDKLAGHVYVKRDGSLRPDKEGDHCHEVTVIAKQDLIHSVIKRVCQTLVSDAVGAYVNNTCGLHVHLDMRNRKHKICYANLVKSLPVLSKMVPSDRTKNNIYCKLNTTQNFDDHEDKDNTTRRRQAINPMSYSEHKTIEVRLHSASVNSTKINNWISILLAIVNKDHVVSTSDYITAPEDMTTCFGISSDLVEYIKKRTDKFKDDKIDTRLDHDQAV